MLLYATVFAASYREKRTALFCLPCISYRIEQMNDLQVRPYRMHRATSFSDMDHGDDTHHHSTEQIKSVLP
jgi:hypothetical protein